MYIYINAHKEIYSVKTGVEPLVDACLTKERILYLIKQNQFNLDDKHRLIDLLKYDLTLAPNDIKDFVANDDDDDHPNNYLVSLKIVDDIHFSETIPMLSDQDSVFFVFTNAPKSESANATTRRVYLKSKNVSTKKKHIK